jgi:hypothetical protein
MILKWRGGINKEGINKEEGEANGSLRTQANIMLRNQIR